MCDALPGKRCASDTCTVANDTLVAYYQTWGPDAPPIGPAGHAALAPIVADPSKIKAENVDAYKAELAELVAAQPDKDKALEAIRAWRDAKIAASKEAPEPEPKDGAASAPETTAQPKPKREPKPKPKKLTAVKPPFWGTTGIDPEDVKVGPKRSIWDVNKPVEDDYGFSREIYYKGERIGVLTGHKEQRVHSIANSRLVYHGAMQTIWEARLDTTTGARADIQDGDQMNETVYQLIQRHRTILAREAAEREAAQG